MQHVGPGILLPYQHPEQPLPLPIGNLDRAIHTLVVGCTRVLGILRSLVTCVLGMPWIRVRPRLGCLDFVGLRTEARPPSPTPTPAVAFAPLPATGTVAVPAAPAALTLTVRHRLLLAAERRRIRPYRGAHNQSAVLYRSLEIFGSSSKHAEIGPESFRIVVSGLWAP